MVIRLKDESAARIPNGDKDSDGGQQQTTSSAKRIADSVIDTDRLSPKTGGGTQQQQSGLLDPTSQRISTSPEETQDVAQRLDETNRQERRHVELVDEGQKAEPRGPIEQAQDVAEDVATEARQQVEQNLSPTTELVVSEQQRQQAQAGEQEITRRAERGNIGARVAVGGEVIQRGFQAAGQQVEEGIRTAQEKVGTTERAIETAGELAGRDIDVPRGPGTRLAEARVGEATVEEQVAGAPRAVIEGTGLIAGGAAQAAGTGAIAAEEALSGGDITDTGRFGELLARGGTRTAETAAARPVETGLVLAAPSAVSRVRGGRGGGTGRTRVSTEGRGARQAARDIAAGAKRKGRVAKAKGVDVRLRARAARRTGGAKGLAQEFGPVKGGSKKAPRALSERFGGGRLSEFAKAERGQAQLLRQKQKPQAQETGAVETVPKRTGRQVAPREFFKSEGVEPKIGSRPPRRGAGDFAQRVREFKSPDEGVPSVEGVGGVDVGAPPGTAGAGLVGGARQRQKQAQKPSVAEEATKPPRSREDTSFTDPVTDFDVGQRLKEREQEGAAGELAKDTEITGVGERPGVRERSDEFERGDTRERGIGDVGEVSDEIEAVDEDEKVGPKFETPTKTITGEIPGQKPIPDPGTRPDPQPDPGRVPRPWPGGLPPIPGGGVGAGADEPIGKFDRVFKNPVATPAQFLTDPAGGDGEIDLDFGGLDFSD